MPVTKITPYLSFDGDAHAAIEHYKTHLGAEVEGLMHFSDLKGHTFGPEANDRVMHCTLKLGGLDLMLSDVPPGVGLTRGGGMSVTLEVDSAELLESAFAGLAEGGEVQMPLQDTFWGARFGQVRDKFGIAWMFNYPLPKEE